MPGQNALNQTSGPAVIAHVPVAQRPAGITVIGTLGAVLRALMLAGGVFLLIVGATANTEKTWGLNFFLGAFAIIMIIVSIPSLVTSIGLLRLKTWARVLAIGGSALGVFAVVTGLKLLPSSPYIGLFLALRSGFDVWILIYLLKPEVKQAFGATSF
jgi:hypothetical protein